MIINKKFLAQYSVLPIPSNFNYDEVMNYVDIAEKIWLLPILGWDWYNEIQEQVDNNTLTPENSTALVEAIYPFLGFAVAYEALPSLMYHVSEVSITKGHSDTSEALTLKELTYYQQHIRNQVEVRKNYLMKWICEHLEYFPLAIPCNCGCSCCNNNAKLNYPNPNYQLYSTYRKNTNLR